MAELGFKLRQPGTTAPKHFLLLWSPTSLEGTEEKLRLRVVRRLAQGHTARQRMIGAPVPFSLHCIPRPGYLSPSSLFSPASLCRAAHSHVHQHARPHAGVCQWLVSAPHPRHPTCILAFDPHNRLEVGITGIIPIIQMSSERLRNLPKVTHTQQMGEPELKSGGGGCF